MIGAAALVLLCALGAAAASAADPAADIRSDLVSGGMVVGATKPGARVFLGNRPVTVGRDGVFVFGFGRDQRGPQQLTTIHSDGSVVQAMLEVSGRAYPIQRIDRLDQNMVTPDSKTEAQIRADQAAVSAARATPSVRRDFLMTFIWPVTGPISGVYGSQRVLNGVPKAPHFGIDIAAPAGTAIVAPADGKVRLSGDGFYLTGGTVILDHGHGIYTSYLHLSAIDVETGQEVRQGDRIGAVGATGRATGPHLHWGLNWNDVRLDPALLVPPMPAPLP